MCPEFRPRILGWWEQAKDGGRILTHPRAYLGRVFLPSFVGWVAMLGVIAVFLAAYGIPVTFDTLMHVVGGNSIANVTSVTPGGVGVTQAFNVASLSGVTSAANATAYSVAQQLVTTAWNILFGVVLMAWAFGWSGGKKLVEDSYVQAKAKQEEQKAAREAEEGSRAECAWRPRNHGLAIFSSREYDAHSSSNDDLPHGMLGRVPAEPDVPSRARARATCTRGAVRRARLTPEHA